MKFTNEAYSRIQLDRSQTSMFYAARGTIIVAIQGSILVCEGGTAADTRFVVSAGECHMVQRSGWVRLEANGTKPSAAIVNAGLPSVPLWQRWWQRAHTLVALKE